MAQWHVWLLRAGIAVLVVGAAYFAWQWLKPRPLPQGFASANGRIEATDIDIATKAPGRVQDIRVDEGDFVTAGQALVRMNTDVLEAQRREAEAQLKRAAIGVDTARAQVVQRKAERQAAAAVVAQRLAALDAAICVAGHSGDHAAGNAVRRDDAAREHAAACAGHHAGRAHHAFHHAGAGGVVPRCRRRRRVAAIRRACRNRSGPVRPGLAPVPEGNRRDELGRARSRWRNPATAGKARHVQFHPFRAGDRFLVIGIGVADDAACRIVPQHALRSLRRFWRAVGDDHHAGMLRVSK